MIKQQFDASYLGKAVHCKTKELADEFLKLADSVGYTWPGGNRIFANDKDYRYEKYSHKTCFVVYNAGCIMFGPKEFYEQHGYEIIEFKSAKSYAQRIMDDANDIMSATQPNLVDIILYELGVKVEEEFYIRRKSTNIIFERYKFYFDNRLKLNCTNPNLKYDIYIGDLINGDYEIIKLPKPLLTNEEKEFLSNFEFVELEKETNYGLLLYIDQCTYHIIGIKHCKHKFDGLEKCKHYTLKELGL